MEHKDVDDILEEIDRAVGPPENETPEEREKRRKMVERDALARKIRKSADSR